MKIGLFGHYTYNDYSDEFIASAIKNAFERKGAEVRVSYFGHDNYSDIDLAILGGGSLLGASLIYMVEQLKKQDYPFVIFGTGFREATDLKSLHYLWNRASLIGVRGKTSVERLNKAGVDIERISFLGDPIFLLKPMNQLSDGYIKAVMRPHPSVDLHWMNRFVKWLSSERSEPYFFLNFSTAQGDWGGQLGLEHTYSEIGKASFWFGNRLHPFCVALINGIPAMAVEVEFRKVEDVCQMLNYPFWVKPGENLQMNYRNLMREWDNIKDAVKYRITDIRHSLENMVEEAIKLA